ncbi:MAG: bifunctional UDP-N-acetylglucosamine diphosphorylase/glucosamine-1-phosphate N-acetyltransferase GlmU [Oscillospiraceae bacterium]
MENTAAIIIAAGNGKRMKSNKPKPMCEVLFKPMINWVLDSCFSAKIERISVVVTDENRFVQDALPQGIQTYTQYEKLGTGHAIMTATDFIKENIECDVFLLCGDAPLIDNETLVNTLRFHRENNNDVTVVSANLNNPFGYGRIIRENGEFICITEEKDANAETKLINEINSGIYCAKASFLLKALPKIQNNNASHEYYLTDIISIAKELGYKTGVIATDNPDSILGANDRKSLAMLNEIARQKVIDKLYDNGVNIPFSDSVIIAPSVKIGCDTTIMPNCIITGDTTIGENCTIGEATIISNSKIGDGNYIQSSNIENSIIENNTHIGPYAHIRPKSHIKNGVKLGNFVEIKSSVIGEKTSVAHLTYLGDSELGSYVNVGCGVVTANYDGKDKHKTIIGDSSFIGCNTNFIPPVKVGTGVVIGAGSTITDDIDDFALAMARAKQTNISEWAIKKGKYKKGLK